MTMTHDDIQGWFDFHHFYDEAVARAPQGALFAEIGCWRGKSTAYLARKIIESGKNIRLVCVDSWLGSSNEPDLVTAAGESDLYAEFLGNMMGCGVDSVLDVRRGDSADVARVEFPPQVFDFVFLDGDHSEAGLTRDLEAWIPRVKPGGRIGGHDWNVYASVSLAVNRYFKNVSMSGGIWFVDLPLS
jgi:predicted O-methyltransferase YrrM